MSENGCTYFEVAIPPCGEECLPNMNMCWRHADREAIKIVMEDMQVRLQEYRRMATLLASGRLLQKCSCKKGRRLAPLFFWRNAHERPCKYTSHTGRV